VIAPARNTYKIKYLASTNEAEDEAEDVE